MPWFETAKKKDKFSVGNLLDLCNDVIKFAAAPERGDVELAVGAVRELAEVVVWGDRHEPKIFDLFLERNMLPYFIKIVLSRAVSRVKVQVIQTLAILLGNLKSLPSVFYLLSQQYMNRLIEYPQFDFDDDEVMSNYISLIKSLSLRFDIDTIQFFYNRDNNTFPLYSAALKFFNHPEALVRAGVRAIFMNICKVNDEYVRNFVLKTKRYQHSLCWSLRQQTQVVDSWSTALEEHLNHFLYPVAFPSPAKPPPTLPRLDNVLQDLVDDMHYVQDLHGLDSPALRIAVESGLRSVLLESFLTASIRGLAEGTAQVSQHVAAYVGAQWAGCARSAELYRVLLEALRGTPFVDEYDEEQAASPADRHAERLKAKEAHADPEKAAAGLAACLGVGGDDPRVSSACVTLLYSWVASPPPADVAEEALLVPHSAARPRRSRRSSSGSPARLAAVAPEAAAGTPAPPAAAGAEAAAVDGEEEEDTPDAPEVAELTGTYILRGAASEPADPVLTPPPGDPADGDELRPPLPPMPQPPPRPADVRGYDYPYDAVDALLLWLCRCVRDLPRRGRLHSIAMCARALLALAALPPPAAVRLAPHHAALLRDAYRTCCCVLRRRHDAFRRELVERQGGRPAVPRTGSRGGAAAASGAALLGGEGRDIHDPLELVFLLLSGEVAQHAALKRARARDLIGDVSQLLPLFSPLAPRGALSDGRESTGDNPSELRELPSIGSGSGLQEHPDAPLLEPSSPSGGDQGPGGPSTPPLRPIASPTSPPLPRSGRSGAGELVRVVDATPPPVQPRSGYPPPPGMGARAGSPAGRRSTDGAAHNASPCESLPASPARRPGENTEQRGPGTYRVVGQAGAMVRRSEGLDSKLVHRLKPGTVVEVYEVRKRRCYITKPVQGWVSLWNSVGGMILQPEGADSRGGSVATGVSSARNPSIAVGQSMTMAGYPTPAHLRGDAPAVPPWLAAVDLGRRLPHDAEELAKVEAVAFFEVRDLVFKLAGRPNDINDYLQVAEGGPFLKDIAKEVNTARLQEGIRCQSCPLPAPPTDSPYCASDFASTVGSVLYLFVEGDELLLLEPSVSQMNTARCVCCCYLFFTYAVVDPRLGFRLTLRCRGFRCALTFENAQACGQIAARINLLARQRREGKCALLAPVLMDSEIPVEQHPAGGGGDTPEDPGDGPAGGSARDVALPASREVTTDAADVET